MHSAAYQENLVSMLRNKLIFRFINPYQLEFSDKRLIYRTSVHGE